MSGDVQPRKRKDKRRKKEGVSLGGVYEPELIHRHKKSESDHKSFELPDQGEKIHVQNEHGIGGNICVKIIFFCLFGLLVGAVGLIYLQSQGSTDIDLPTVEESRFAEYFTGWLDDNSDDHEHEALENNVNNEHDEHEEHNDHDKQEHEDEDDHEKDDLSAEQDSIFKLFGLQGEEDKEEPNENEVTSDARESEESGIKDDKDEKDEYSEDKKDENSEFKEDENSEDKEDDEDQEEDDSRVEDDDEDEDDASQIDEDEQMINKLEEENDELTEEDKSDDKEKEEKEEEEKEEAEKKEDRYEDDVEDENSNDLGSDEIYESEEDEDTSKPEDIEEAEEEEKTAYAGVESAVKDEEDNSEEESGGVAVKVVVGIALIIVAHLVLVQKWKSMSNASTDENTKTLAEKKTKEENLTSDAEPLISRRQTLVPENVPLNDDWEEKEDELDEEYSEEEKLDEEYSEEEKLGEEYSEEEKLDEEYSEEKKVDEELVKKTEKGNVETFENLLWDAKEENEDEDFEENMSNGEEEIEEEEEEKEYEDEEEYEEDDYETKKPDVEEDEEPAKKEVTPETTPTPPPRIHKGGRGPQEFEEDFVGQFEEINRQDGVPVRETENVPETEERKRIDPKTENDDWAFREEFNFADEQFENNPKAAVRAYEKILAKKPKSLRALIGRARALDHLAEKEKSNAYLKQAINAYKSLFLEHGHLLDDDTYVKLSERCIERIRFSGAFSSAIDVHKGLITKFPNTPKYRNALAVTYLMLNRIPQARAVLNETLTLWPEDGFALVHYGFILKTSDNNMEEGAKKLMAGIETKQEGVIDGMFFFHLGDALNRLGRGQEAMNWYELGVKEGLFLSKYQRSLYNVKRLKGQPWWTKEETTYQNFFRRLEQNWREIRKEGLELLNSKGVNLFKQEAENLKDTGDWKQLDLYFRGRKQAICDRAPVTCGLVSSFKPASTCTRGQIKFSVMLPNTHVWPHCGPTNCRLRSHLGLVVPEKTYIRVAEEMRSWEEGKLIIFDDSFEHEVWHNGTGLRLVLIVDVWHPELTDRERLTLSPI